MQAFVNELVIGLFVKNSLFWLLMILAIVSTVFYKQIIGKMGEIWTSRELKHLGREYLILNDIMIKTSDNKTHQIDHIVVSQYGIFVIETKQYNGYITGSEYDKKWCIKTGKSKLYINNPFHQNYGHIKALEEILNLDEDKFISLVCIPSSARLKVNSSNLVRSYSILGKIKSYNQIVLNNYEEIFNIIKGNNIVDKDERKKHNKYAQNVKKEAEIESVNKCPKCGGKLVKRKGKYGDFVGCSNYPKCKYTTRNGIVYTRSSRDC